MDGEPRPRVTSANLDDIGVPHRFAAGSSRCNDNGRALPIIPRSRRASRSWVEEDTPLGAKVESRPVRKGRCSEIRKCSGAQELLIATTVNPSSSYQLPADANVGCADCRASLGQSWRLSEVAQPAGMVVVGGIA